MSETKTFLLIPRIRIQQANALSSPYSIGFPALTAWLGAVHYLERQLKHNKKIKDEGEDYEDLSFKRVGVVCHDFNLHTYRGNNDYFHSIINTANPLTKEGNRPAFIEQARCDLEASIIIDYDVDDDDNLCYYLNDLIKGHFKIAGGDVLKANDTLLINQEHLIAKLMPSYALIERRDLIQEAMKEGQDALDAILAYLQVNHEWYPEKKQWQSQRKEKGWFVPIATGFYGLNDLGIIEQQRDQIDHRFAESLVTLGEFIMPYRLENNLDKILWHYVYNEESKEYYCTTEKTD